MCKHCDHIREVTNAVLGFTMMNWTMRDIAQAAAYIHARIRHNAKQSGDKEEKEFLLWFERIADVEFQELNHSNPIEPAKFDESYDYREHMKGE